MHSRLLDYHSIFILNTIKKQLAISNNNMDAAAASNTTTFEPSSDLIQEDDCNTLLLYLPGFTKEQLRVQLTRARVLKISGRRPLGNNRWNSFQKDFPVLENCDTNKITAKFEDGILYVRQPKEEKKLAAAEAQQPQKPAEGAQPPSPPPPPSPTKTALITEDKKEITAPPIKPVYQSKAEIRSAEPSGERESGRKVEQRHAAEGSGGDRKGAAERGAAKVEADYTKLSAESPAARLKAARKKMTDVLLLLFVFALGIYVSKLPWFSKN